MYRCPGCNNFGVYPVRRRWWQRLFRLSHHYYCYDCGKDCIRPELVDDGYERLPPQGDRALNKANEDKEGRSGDVT